MKTSNIASFIIECPHCGAQYLPGEIFLPKEFLGEPKNVDKDENGKILSYVGTNMNTVENYICDYCGTNFKVRATINMNARTDVKHDFSKPYKVLIKDEADLVLEET